MKSVKGLRALAIAMSAMSVFAVPSAVQAAYNSPDLVNLSLAGVNGPLTAGQYEFDTSRSGLGTSFGDTWQFTLASTSNAQLAVAPSEFSLNGLTLVGTSLSGSFGLSTIPIGGVVDLGRLLAGTIYTISLNGVTTGLLGGGYDGVLKVAPVPVPASLWLLGSGVVGLMLFARRRHQLANYV